MVKLYWVVGLLAAVLGIRPHLQLPNICYHIWPILHITYAILFHSDGYALSIDNARSGNHLYKNNGKLYMCIKP